MSGTFAEFITAVPDSDIPLLRELLADDVLLDCSTKFRREASGNLLFEVMPGPLHWSRQSEFPWVLKHGDFTKDQRVLEVGGGHTVLKFALARRVKLLLGTEFEGWYMPEVQKTVDQLGYNNIVLVRADARDLPWPDAWFDRVVCVSTLEHIPEGREQALGEMIRVLRPGGVLLLTADVFLQGEKMDGFYLDPDGVTRLATRLGIAGPRNGVQGAAQLGAMTYTVILFRYVKPAGAV